MSDYFRLRWCTKVMLNMWIIITVLKSIDFFDIHFKQCNFFRLPSAFWLFKSKFQFAHDSGGSNRVRNESDPHIVTGVLQKTLKELSPSPLYEVYEDILSTEISEDSAHSRIIVQNWLVKLPQDRFELVSDYLICLLHFLFSFYECIWFRDATEGYSCDTIN